MLTRSHQTLSDMSLKKNTNGSAFKLALSSSLKNESSPPASPRRTSSLKKSLSLVDITKHVRTIVSKKKIRFVDDKFDLDLTCTYFLYKK